MKIRWNQGANGKIGLWKGQVNVDTNYKTRNVKSVWVG